jgi:flavin reductase (DIM6/NTAB) family NADH-FMN oxidoreductase RutF
MDYDPRTEPHKLKRDPVTSLVVPRPIGWITTMTETGLVNLAPYSFFNLISGRKQPFVMFSSSGRKHTQRNAETAGEFVFNLATFELRTEMNQTSAELDETVSEPEFAGLAMVPSRFVSRRGSRCRRSRSSASTIRPSPWSARTARLATARW